MFSLLLYKASLLLFGFCAVLIARHLHHVISIRIALTHVPGPDPPSFFWGEEWNLFTKQPGSLYVDWHQRFGCVVAFTGAFGHRVLSITDPRAINFVLSEAAYSFPKPLGVRAWFLATLGEGILWVEGKRQHELQRRDLAPALNQASVKQLNSIFLDTSTTLAEQWDQILAQNDEEAEIEITDWAGRFALDTVGKAAFSYEFNCLSGGSKDLAAALDGLTNSEHKRSSFYMRALFWLMPSILSVGEKGAMIRKVKHELGTVAAHMLNDARHANDPNCRSILSNMLRSGKSAQLQMSEGEIISQMRTIVSAGYETVSAIVAWMFYELAMNIKVQCQLREEITGSDRSRLNHLPLLDAVVKEALRMHPPISENHHEAAETMVIPLADSIGEGEMHLVVPKGTLIVIPLHVLHRDVRVWGDDSDIFRPSRWLDSDTSNSPKGRELWAFGAGPRSCIGKTFALAEVKVLVATVIPQFSFTCSKDIESFQSFVVRPRVKGEMVSSLPLTMKKVESL